MDSTTIRDAGTPSSINASRITSAAGRTLDAGLGNPPALITHSGEIISYTRAASSTRAAQERLSTRMFRPSHPRTVSTRPLSRMRAVRSGTASALRRIRPDPAFNQVQTAAGTAYTLAAPYASTVKTSVVRAAADSRSTATHAIAMSRAHTKPPAENRYRTIPLTARTSGEFGRLIIWSAGQSI